MPDGSWARSMCGVLVARQCGKTHMMRMRILAGLYVFGEKNAIAMAQTRQLSLDTFKQTVDMAESLDWMRKRIKRVSRTNGQEELEVYCHHYPKSCGGKCERIRKYSIRAATSEGPRGSSADLLYVDELREIDVSDKKYRRVWTQPIGRYGSNYNLFDVSLAPIIPSEFNSCKSQLKIIEAGFHKKPIIASETMPYTIDLKTAYKEGKLLDDGNALLVHENKNHKLWSKYMKLLIDNPNMVEDLGNRLYETVKDKYSLVTVSKNRTEFFKSII